MYRKFVAEREFWLNEVKRSWFSLAGIPQYNDDEEIVLAAAASRRKHIKNASSHLSHYVSERLRDDEKVMLEIIRTSHEEFRFASSRLKASKSFVLKALQVNSKIFQYLDESFRDDLDIAAKATQRSMPLLAHVSDRLRNDSSFMLPRIRKNAKAIEFLGDMLKQDPAFLNEISQFVSNPQHLLATPESRAKEKQNEQSRRVLLRALQKFEMTGDSYSLTYALSECPKNSIKDKHILLDIVKVCPDYAGTVLYIADKSLQRNGRFVFAWLKASRSITTIREVGIRILRHIRNNDEYYFERIKEIIIRRGGY